MRTFNDIYNSIKPDFVPQPRSIIDLGIILSKIYEVLKSEKYIEYSPFDVNDHPFVSDRTTIERLIKELSEIKTLDKGFYMVSSEGIERVISSTKTLEINTLNPNTDSNDSKMYDFIFLRGQLLYLIDVCREGLIFTKKKIILDNVNKLNGKNEKINYLNTTLLSIKQNENLWDKVQFKSITDFLELEVKKWELFKDDQSEPEFKSTYELHNYVVNLIKEKLIHNIRYQEGYRVFWRDEQSLTKPKKEIEIQPFIKSILKPYCDAKNIKIHRESTVANGYIDMTFTYLGFSVCLEIKKAQHQDILTAINSQLSEYMIGEETDYGIYMILWYKSINGYDLPKKFNSFEELTNKIEIESDTLKYEIVGLDCTKPISPSLK